MNRVLHFEIQAEDLDRAKKFYSEVFGWEFEDYSQYVNSPYFGIITGKEDEKGINGGLMPRPAKTPPDEYGTNAFVCTIVVEDFDNFSKKILDYGGKIALPKYALPGMAWQGYLIDTEGNTFGLHQEDKDAK